MTATLLAFATSGCIAPVKPTAQIQSGHGEQATAEFLIAQAKKCWARDQNFFLHDGIRIDASRRLPDGPSMLYASRFARDIGIDPAFVRIEIIGVDPHRSLVAVGEGDYALGAHLDFTSDVKRWFAGDLACR